MIEIDASKLLRVSVATYNRVVFPHPQNGTSILALECKATVLNGSVRVRAQPFGGAVRILDPAPLQELIGKIQFDSNRSKQDRDFRILIPPSKWEPVKKYCLRHLQNPASLEMESAPDRELVEEFEETINARLKPDQYTVQPIGFVIENNPVPTENTYAYGQLTVRLYRIFEVRITDAALCKIMINASERHSDQDLRMLALKDLQNGGKGHAHSVLCLPLHMVRDSFLTFARERRYRKIAIKNHELDESMLAILDDIEVPQYQRA